jgi:putative transposase
VTPLKRVAGLDHQLDRGDSRGKPYRKLLRELTSQRRRFGYRRLHILMIREGLPMNHKKLRRLCRKEGLQVRRRGGRKRAMIFLKLRRAIPCE